MNHDMEEKGVVDVCGLPELLCQGPGAQLRGGGVTSSTASPEDLRESANGNQPLLLRVVVQSGLQIDVDGPETSENPTQS